VFNFEGGCYAKAIHLSQDAEPEIFETRRFGTVMENVVFDPITRVPNFDSDATTENTGVTYLIYFITDASRTGGARQARDPRHRTPRRSPVLHSYRPSRA